jgi:hypothetical protein
MVTCHSTLYSYREFCKSVPGVEIVIELKYLQRCTAMYSEVDRILRLGEMKVSIRLTKPTKLCYCELLWKWIFKHYGYKPILSLYVRA